MARYNKAAARAKAAKRLGKVKFSSSELSSYKAGAKRGQRNGYIKAAKKFNPK